MGIKIEGGDSRFSLIRPIKSQPREGISCIAESAEQLLSYIERVGPGEIVALDFETRGTDITKEGFEVIGFGLGSGIGNIYVDIRDVDVREVLPEVVKLPLIAHNIFFDAACLHFLGYPMREVNWQYCTYRLLKDLAGEGFKGQQWGLKYAQVEILGWRNTNEFELDCWLVRHGWIMGQGGRRDDMTREELWEMYRKLSRRLRANKEIRPDKGEMWRVPIATMGKYCNLDADSTWQLFTQVLEPALKSVPEQAKIYHQQWVLPVVAVLIDMQVSGTYIDIPRLEKWGGTLTTDMGKGETKFRNLVSPQITEFEGGKFADFLSGMPEKYLKEKDYPEPSKYLTKKTEPREPVRKFKKNGTVTKSWLNWSDRHQLWGEADPAINQNWLKWRERRAQPTRRVSKIWENWNGKREAILEGSDPELNKKFKFNTASPVQLRWLLYGRLNSYQVVREHVSEKERGQIKLDSGIILDMTKTGELPTDISALRHLGDAGGMLHEISLLRKELGYVDACLLKVNRETSLVHLQTNIGGTVTGRFSGIGGLNYQQLPKSREYLSCWVAKPGYTLIDADWESVEPHVLAEIARCPTLLGLCGPNVKQGNDVYLYIGSKLGEIGKVLLDDGYDPDNPDPVLIEKLKIKYKRLRSIFKILHLSCSYGAGPVSIHKTLINSSIEITLGEVIKLHREYWRLFSALKELESELRSEWQNNNGWILNGIGRPLCLAESREKDLINACVRGDTQVLTTRGLIEIERVRDGDLIWDGVEFVSHSGLIHQGEREVITRTGLTCTPDHDIIVNISDNTRRAARDVEEIPEAELPKYSWRDLWRLLYNLGSKVGRC